MSTTEKKLREYEELKTINDYMGILQEFLEVATSITGTNETVIKTFEDSIQLLSDALKEKLKYMLALSKKWRKKQGFFSKLRDTLLEKQEIRLLKQQMKKEALLEDLKSLKKEVKEAKSELTETTKALDVSLSQASQVPKETEVVDTIEPSNMEVLEEGESSSLLEF